MTGSRARQVVAPAGLAAVLAGLHAWGAVLLPWHTGPSLAWLLWGLSGSQLWFCGAWLAGYPEAALRVALRAGVPAMALVTAGVAWASMSLVQQYGQLGQGLVLGAALALGALWALNLPAALWAWRRLRELRGGSSAAEPPAPDPPQPAPRAVETGEAPRAKRWRELSARSIPVLAAAIVAWPATWPLQQDSFPLSPYPMFARQRRSLTITRAVGVLAGGQRRRVPASALFQGEPLQARVLLIQLGASASHSQLEPWCERLKKRSSEVVELRGLSALLLEQAAYDPLPHLLDGAPPSEVRELARCSILDSLETR